MLYASWSLIRDYLLGYGTESKDKPCQLIKHVKKYII